MRILFAGTPDFAKDILQALLKAKYNIIACLTQPDKHKGRGNKLSLSPSPVKLLSQQYNIPILTPISLKKPGIIEKIAILAPDIIVVVAYGLLIPKDILELPRFGCINIHASILPRWRGAAPIQYAILSGDKTTGITIMQMDPGLDTGDILSVYPCSIEPHDTSTSLTNKLSIIGQKAIVETIDNIVKHKIKPSMQDNKLASYAPRIDKKQACLDWKQSAEVLERSVRAYQPWPVAYSYLESNNIRIWQAEVVSADNLNTSISRAKPGSICNINKHGVDVVTGDGVLRLIKMQLPGKKILHVQDILNGNHPFKLNNLFSCSDEF